MKINMQTKVQTEQDFYEWLEDWISGEALQGLGRTQFKLSRQNGRSVTESFEDVKQRILEIADKAIKKIEGKNAI